MSSFFLFSDDDRPWSEDGAEGGGGDGPAHKCDNTCLQAGHCHQQQLTPRVNRANLHLKKKKQVRLTVVVVDDESMEINWDLSSASYRRDVYHEAKRTRYVPEGVARMLLGTDDLVARGLFKKRKSYPSCSSVKKGEGSTRVSPFVLFC